MTTDAPGVAAARLSVINELEEMHRRRDRLANLLAVDPALDQGAWQQHGALLAAVDRLRVEVAAAVRPSDQNWRPPPAIDRRRLAPRRTAGSVPTGRGRRT